MQKSSVPAHIAIVMDGNGRWAKKRFLPRIAGHKQGLEALKLCLENGAKRGVRVLTVFAFSSENWSRPEDEVSGLFDLFAKALSSEVPQLHAQGVQLHFIGELSSLSEKLQANLHRAQLQTADNTKLVLNVCFNYGGRWDMTQAAAQVQAKGLPITQELIEAHLALSHVDAPDLVIRTGGEVRISNFLLWQAAYSEWFFSSALWPEFGEAELDEAIANYAQRERRFGRTSEQLGRA